MKRLSGSAALVVGGLMIVVGALALVFPALRVPVLPVEFGWPLFVLLPGLVLLVAALASRRLELAIPGTIVTAVGLVLAYQNTTGHWESWAYAWTLVGPTAVGVAQLLIGSISGNRDLIRNGGRVAMVGLGLFALGLMFFEGIIGISGRDLGVLGRIGVPVVLILFGLALVLRRGTVSRE